MNAILIDGFPNYFVCDTGEIYNIRTGHQKVPRDNGVGYQQVQLHRNGKAINKYVHKLVASHFENIEYTDEVNHIDGDKTNNYLDNLEKVTHKENYLHAVKTGLIKKNKLGQWS